MFVVLLTYTRSLDQVDEQLSAHRAFLERQYQAGVFIASGPQIPRAGGVILARGLSREDLQTLLAQDPFALHGLASYSIVEFQARAVAPEMSAYIEN
ncbi:YciI family protein [Paludibacterium yongneupense]|uniref:YciI family protein n=1 Tax=Paludibacterium yongneupense TaxID=400061 RepID=UPI0003FF0F33|nr:YciI family protein [Paludibacterium yongneupense]